MNEHVNISEIMSILESSRQIICFGRGEGFLCFSRMMNSMGMDDKILYVVDNDKTLWDTRVPGYDKSWDVCPPEKMYTAEDYSIVITTGSDEAFDQIREQIRSDTRLSDIEVVYYKPIFHEWIRKKQNSLNIREPFRVYTDQVIPKTIHYCWFGNNPFPLDYIEWMNSWKKYCPDYEIIRWDERNYDVNKIKYMSDAYKAEKWGFVSDYARLDIIYTYGGIYLDTDVELLKPLDDFLYEDGFAGYMPDERVNTGLGFGARKGLQIIKRLMDDYNNREFVCAKNRKEKIAIQMCSEIQTEYLLRNPNWKYTNDIVDMDGLRVYPSPILDGKNADKETMRRLSYSIHHYSGSWLNKENQ